MRPFPILALLTACATNPGPPSDAAQPPVLPDPPPAAPAVPSPAPVAPDPPPPNPGEATTAVRLTLVRPALAEDGRGGRVRSQAPVAIEVDSRGWPGRAMEPALIVGDRRFEAYTHVSPVTIRFVAADAALLPEGAEASIRYGDDTVATFALPAVEAP